MSGHSQREACEEVAAIADQQQLADRSEEVAMSDQHQQEQQPADWSEEVAMSDQTDQQEQQPGDRSEEIATPARAPGDTRRASATATSTMKLEEREEEQAEPGKSNAARALTLLGVAQRLRHLLSAEAQHLLRLQEDVESVLRASALARPRLWLLELGFHRRLRAHLESVRREMCAMLDVFAHCDYTAPARQHAPRLSAYWDYAPPPVGSPAPPQSCPPPPPPPDDRRHGDSKASVEVKSVVAADDRDVWEAVEACAETFSSSGGESVRASPEEVADVVVAQDVAVAVAAALAGEEVAAAVPTAIVTEEVAAPVLNVLAPREVADAMATKEVAAAVATATSGGAAGGDEEVARPFSPVPWSQDRIEKKRSEETPGSSNGSDKMESASALQETCAGPSGAAAVDTPLVPALDKSEKTFALEVFGELQRQFQHMTEALWQYAVVADGVLVKPHERRLLQTESEGAERQEGREGRLPPQLLLLRDIAQVHYEAHSAQAIVLLSEAALQRILSALPPPSPPHRRGLGLFSAIKRRLSRRK